MGGQISTASKLTDNELLRKFTGLEPITDNDPFWNQLLSFNYRVTDSDKKEIEEFEANAGDLLDALMYNTPTTGNFAAFIRVLLRRATELKESAQCNDKIFLWQMSNALVILRICSKFLTRKMGEKEFSRLFAKNILNINNGKVEICEDYEEPFHDISEELLNSLVEILVDLPVNEATISTHAETVKVLLVLLSSQLYEEKPNIRPNSFISYLHRGRCTIHAPLLTKALLNNYLCYNTTLQDPSAFDGGGSLVLGIAAAAFSVWQWVATDEEEEEEERRESSESQLEPTLGNLSLLLVLTMFCHNGNQDETTDPNRPPNPYLDALGAFQNSQENATMASAGQAAAAFRMDYGTLYEKLCQTVFHESAMLLLYLLLHQNMSFRNYVLSRVNLENLVLPVIRVLHKGQQNHEKLRPDSHHVYLALIVMLILSEDDYFCKVIHETTIKNVDWLLADQKISEISLGGLIAIILIRTIQLNIVKMRDRYLHTNCLAALANMSPHFKNLPSPVCQKLIGLLEVLSKRHTKLVEHLRRTEEFDLQQNKEDNLVQQQQQDVTAIEEAIRTLLEIINSCLTTQLRNNPHLIYTMLYKRQLFDSFQQHPMFQDLCWNLVTVLNHFASKISASVDKGASVSEVLGVIQKGALQWPTDRLKKFPELKFTYVEDENTEEFFVPYVWKLVYKHAGLYWDPVHIKLFHAQNLSSKK